MPYARRADDSPPKRQPWLKWYPSDWRGDEKLQMCSLGARGLWAECCNLMHFGTPYGYLVLNGKAPSDAELAKAVRARSLRELQKFRKELEVYGVPGITSAGIWFSRRMVRKAEESAKNSENGKKGGNPALKPRLKRPDKARLKTHMLEARSIDTKEQYLAPTPKAPSPVKLYLDWFQAEYKKRRNGATYFVRWDAHSAIVKRLLAAFPADRLQKHAQLLLTTNEEWTQGTDRGIEVLSGKINWLEERLCAWEAQKKGRETV